MLSWAFANCLAFEIETHKNWSKDLTMQVHKEASLDH